jgi:hypothetical protein
MRTVFRAVAPRGVGPRGRPPLGLGAGVRALVPGWRTVAVGLPVRVGVQNLVAEAVHPIAVTFPGSGDKIPERRVVEGLAAMVAVPAKVVVAQRGHAFAPGPLGGPGALPDREAFGRHRRAAETQRNGQVPGARGDRHAAEAERADTERDHLDGEEPGDGGLEVPRSVGLGGRIETSRLEGRQRRRLAGEFTGVRRRRRRGEQDREALATRPGPVPVTAPPPARLPRMRPLVSASRPITTRNMIASACSLGSAAMRATASSVATASRARSAVSSRAGTPAISSSGVGRLGRRRW